VRSLITNRKADVYDSQHFSQSFALLITKKTIKMKGLSLEKLHMDARAALKYIQQFFPGTLMYLEFKIR